MKRVIVFGGTGFIGSRLVQLLRNDYEIVIPSRKPEKHQSANSDSVKLISYGNPELLSPFFEGAYAVINLAGENVGGRWTKKKKELIYNSRINTDRLICRTFELVEKYPEVVLQGSGMGVYGTETGDEPVTEKSPLGTDGFLVKTGVDHERALENIKNKTRLVFLRTGLVLDVSGGSFPAFLLPFKMFAGGPMGSGNQWVSWIMLEDEVHAIRFLMENKKLSGPFNLTAPRPVREKEMADLIGKLTRRPSWFRTPSFLLRFLMKEMADELILNGKKILPERLLQEGFEFRYARLEEALAALLSK